MTDLDEDNSFPFRDVDEEEFVDTGKARVGDHPHRLHGEYENLNFKTFDYTEHKLHEIENDTELENHFYNNINNNCEYHTDEQFNSNVNMEVS